MYQIFDKLLNNKQAQYDKKSRLAVKLLKSGRVKPLSEEELKKVSGGREWKQE